MRLVWRLLTRIATHLGKCADVAEDEECQCGTLRLLWHDALLCVMCDNREDGEATWFVELAENER